MDSLLNETAVFRAIDKAVDKRLAQRSIKPEQEWLNQAKSAKFVGTSPPTFRKWVEKYEIPYASIDGIKRFAKTDLDKFMKEHKK